MNQPTEKAELLHRLRQQELISAFGAEALRSEDLGSLLQRATELCSEGLSAELCKILEHRPDDGCFLVCAGVGWDPGVIGHATVGSDIASPCGFAFKTGQPVVSNHLGKEDRFRTPELLQRHGVKRAINVLIATRDRNFGVLEVDTREEGEFTDVDVIFLRSFANMVGVAIDQQHAERRLQASLDRQELLGHELNHRVKNVYAVVSSLIAHAGRDDPGAAAALSKLRDRVRALASAHDLSVSKGTGAAVDLREMITVLLRPYGDDGSRFAFTGPHTSLPADRVMPLGLILHELATNAAKYGSLSEIGGRVSVTWGLTPSNALHLTWEEADGPPVTAPAATGFGTRLITLAVRQVDGSLERVFDPTGVRLELSLPL